MTAMPDVRPSAAPAFLALDTRVPATLRDLLVEAGRDDILITGGGIIPKEDMDALHDRGVGRLFGPGPPTSDLVDYIKDWFTSHQPQDA